MSLVQEQRDQLNRLTEPHVVGEAAPMPRRVEEREPLEPAELVRAKGPEEVFGLDDIPGATSRGAVRAGL